MALKSDPRDDRIAELELQLEAAGKAIATAETSAQTVPALNSEIEQLKAIVSTKDREIVSLKTQIETLANGGKTNDGPTITGLDAAKAVQLKVSSMFTNAQTKSAVHGVAGDVICLLDSLEEVQKKVGTAANIHPVSKDEFEATKQAKRCY